MAFKKGPQNFHAFSIRHDTGFALDVVKGIRRAANDHPAAQPSEATQKTHMANVEKIERTICQDCLIGLHGSTLSKNLQTFSFGASKGTQNAGPVFSIRYHSLLAKQSLALLELAAC